MCGGNVHCYRRCCAAGTVSGSREVRRDNVDVAPLLNRYNGFRLIPGLQMRRNLKSRAMARKNQCSLGLVNCSPAISEHFAPLVVLCVQELTARLILFNLPKA